MAITRDDLIREALPGDYGTCRGCGHDLVASEQDQDAGPLDEVLLECGVLDTQDCVAGEWFKISEFVE